MSALMCRRYGNTSSGSLWYALSYIEAAQSVRKGEVVWQVCDAEALMTQSQHAGCSGKLAPSNC